MYFHLTDKFLDHNVTTYTLYTIHELFVYSCESVQRVKPLVPIAQVKLGR